MMLSPALTAIKGIAAGRGKKKYAQAGMPLLLSFSKIPSPSRWRINPVNTSKIPIRVINNIAFNPARINTSPSKPWGVKIFADMYVKTPRTKPVITPGPPISAIFSFVFFIISIPTIPVAFMNLLKKGVRTRVTIKDNIEDIMIIGSS